MIACEQSDGGGGGGCAEQFSPPRLQLMRSAAESNGCGDGRVERVVRQADRSVLLHGLCAATIALATARVIPALAFTAFTGLAACLVGVRVLSPALRTLSFWAGAPCCRRSAHADDIDRGCPRNDDGQSVQRRRPPAPPATTTSGGEAVPLVRRALRLLMRVMRGVQRFVVMRPKRSQRTARRRHDTTSGAVTTVTACSSTVTNTVETVTGSRTGNDYVHRSQRRYLVCTSREQR